MDLQSLLDGKASAFTHIHNAAMVSLVSDHPPLKTENCPETLLLDVNRLAYLQSEFKYIALAATILVTAGHSLAATRLPQDAQVSWSVRLASQDCSLIPNYFIQVLLAIAQSFVDESRRDIVIDQVA